LSTPSHYYCLYEETAKFLIENSESFSGFSSAATLDLAHCP
jgi:hypothetical protein